MRNNKINISSTIICQQGKVRICKLKMKVKHRKLWKKHF